MSSAEQGVDARQVKSVSFVKARRGFWRCWLCSAITDDPQEHAAWHVNGPRNELVMGVGVLHCDVTLEDRSHTIASVVRIQ